MVPPLSLSLSMHLEIFDLQNQPESDYKKRKDFMVFKMWIKYLEKKVSSFTCCMNAPARKLRGLMCWDSIVR